MTGVTVLRVVVATIAARILLRVPEFAADIVGVKGAEDARCRAVVGIAVENTIRPNHPTAGRASIGRNREHAAWHTTRSCRHGARVKRGTIEGRAVELELPQEVVLSPDINQRAGAVAVPIHWGAMNMDRRASVVYESGLELLHDLRIVGDLVAHVVAIEEVKDPIFASTQDKVGSGNQKWTGRTQVAVTIIHGVKVRRRKPVLRPKTVAGVQFNETFSEVRRVVESPVAGHEEEVSIEIHAGSLPGLPNTPLRAAGGCH